MNANGINWFGNHNTGVCYQTESSYEVFKLLNLKIIVYEAYLVALLKNNTRTV